MSAPLRLPAREESLPELLRLAVAAAEQAGLDEATRQHVELVLEETLVTIIRHAYPADAADRPVELACHASPGELTLVVVDHGRPFDPMSEDANSLDLAANLDADLDSRAPGGLGLILIRGMSRASYERRDDANVLTLRFPAEA